MTRIHGTRIVASPKALDSAQWPDGAIALRTSPDEVLVIAPSPTLRASPLRGEGVRNDPHALIVPDAGFAGVWLPMAHALDFLSRECEWEIPTQRPAFVQGAVAGLAMKLWFEQDRVLLVVPAPFAHELEERIGA